MENNDLNIASEIVKLIKTKDEYQLIVPMIPNIVSLFYGDLAETKRFFEDLLNEYRALPDKTPQFIQD